MSATPVTRTLLLLLLSLVGLSAHATSQGGNMRDTEWNNAGGHWPWPTPYDPGCSCYVNPIKITPPGAKSLFASDAVKWDPSAPGGPIAGVSLDWIGGKVFSVPFTGIDVPLPIHRDIFQGDISNYLETPSHGQCEGTSAPCPEVTSCSFTISFTLDATSASHDDSVEWTATSYGPGTGSVSTSKEQEKGDPTKRIINLTMQVEPGCGGWDKVGTIEWDGGITQPTRIFQELRMGCTKCANN